MADESIRVELDVSDVNAAARTFQSALAKNVGSTEGFLASLAKFNEQGTIFAKVFENFGNASKIFESSITKGITQVTALGNTSHIAAAKLQELVDAQKKITDFENFGRYPIVPSGGSRALEKPITPDIEVQNITTGINLVQSKILQLSTIVKSAPLLGYIPSALKDVHVEFDRHVRDITNIISADEKLIEEQRKLARVTKETNAGWRKTLSEEERIINERINKARLIALSRTSKATTTAGAETFVGNVANQFPVPPTASISAISSYQNALNNLNNVVKNTKISFQTLNDQFNLLKNNPAAQVGQILTPGLQQTNSAILRVLSSYKSLQATGEESGRGILISWQSVVRLMEGLVIRRTLSELSNQFRIAAEAAIEFQIKVAQVAATSGNNATELSAQFTNFSNKFGVSQQEIAESFGKVSSSGIGNVKDQFLILNQALDVTRATGINTTTVVEGITHVLGAFQLSGINANRVAETLFTLAQNHNVTFDKLAQSVGSLGITSRQLGVSFEQTAAAVAVMTSQSIDASRAFTSLNSLLSELAKPSRTAKPVVDQIFGDVRTLIATEGLVGVFTRLNNLTEQNLTNLDAVGLKIRDLRGDFALTGEGLKVLGDASKQAGAGLNTLGEASQQVGATTAKNLQTQFEQVKNFFTNEIGNVLINSILPVINTFGGLVTVTKAFIEIIKIGVTALVAYKSATIAYNVVAAIAGAVSRTAGLGIASMGTSATTSAIGVSRLSLALKGLQASTIVGLGAVALGVVLEQTVFAADKVTETFQKIEEQKLKLQEQDREQTNNEIKENAKRQADFEKSYDTRAAVVLKFTSDLVAKQRDATKALNDQQTALNDALKVSFKTLTDNISAGISKLKKDANEAQSEIRRSQEQIEKFKTKAVEDAFSFALKFEEDPTIQLDLIKKRIGTLNTEATALFQQGDKASVDSARIKFQEIEKLQDQQFSNQVRIQKTLFEQDVKKGLVRPELDFAGRETFRFTVSAAQFERERNGLIGQRIALEQQFQALENQREAKLKAQAEVEKTRLRTLEESIKHVTEFSLQDKQKRLKPEFTGPTGKDALKKALGDFLINQRIILEESGADYLKYTQTKIDLEARFNNIVQQFRAERKLRDLESAENSIRQITEGNKKRERLLNEQVIKEKESERTKTTDIITEAQKIVEGLELSRSKTFLSPKNIPEVGQFDEALKNLRINFDAFAENKSPEALEKLKLALQSIVEPLNNFLHSSSQVKGEGAELLQQVVTDKVKQITDSITSLSDIQGKIQTDTQALSNTQKKAIDDLATVIGKLPKEYQATAAAAISAGQTQSKSAQDVAVSLDQIITKLQQINALQGGKGITPIGGAVPAPGFAEGGPIFSPRGTDTVPAMLTPGEFIINPDSAKRFYSQLVAINSGVQPRYYGSGGAVTNVGDVNITVQGGDTSETTVRDIAQALRRELRRGTISFG